MTEQSRRLAALDGRVAIVTGGSQGLGHAIARALFEHGSTVVIASRDSERLEAAAARIDSSGERVLPRQVDVRDRGSFEALFGGVVADFGRVDILVNNAARSVKRPFWEIDDAEWDDVLGVNLRSVLVGCQIAGAHMRANGFGRIVNHASLAGQQGGAVMGAHYAASKAGIIVLTKIVARELAPYGVTVNAIAPAAISGPVMDGLSVEQVEELERSIPIRRVGRPEEVGALAAFLCSEQAAYITGATLDINGGLFMR